MRRRSSGARGGRSVASDARRCHDVAVKADARAIADPESPSPLRRLVALGADETETEDERLRRSTLVLWTCLVCALTPIWVVTYFALGLFLPGAIPLGYLVVTIALLLRFSRTKRYALFRTTQL